MALLPDLVVLDFAGTTMQDDGAVLAAYREALTRHGIAFSEADLSARRGASKRAVFAELAARNRDDGDVETVANDALATFQAALRRAYERGPVEEIPGTTGVVTWLREQGVKVALTSGFDRALVDLLVGRLGWQPLFDVVLAASDVPLGRPAPFLIYRAMMGLLVPDVSRVAVAGDTPLDLMAAANARTGWAIGVLSGAHGIDTMARAPHTHLLTSVAELPGVFGVEQSRSRGVETGSRQAGQSAANGQQPTANSR